MHSLCAFILIRNSIMAYGSPRGSSTTIDDGSKYSEILDFDSLNLWVAYCVATKALY